MFHVPGFYREEFSESLPILNYSVKRLLTSFYCSMIFDNAEEYNRFGA